ncbi:phosphonoacetaldehyde reductase [Eubacteriales bacterium OttesenSCG-928-N13]|nr:phosphonoacetaldehyde reductase [Eubacteriales bacterium OttesenSCG-928-N13]
MAQQLVLVADDAYRVLDEAFSARDIHRVFVVCDDALRFLRINAYFERQTDGRFVFFSDFSPNPQYTSIVEGVRRFRAEPFDAILAIGGGSAIDVAKCIKLFATMNEGVSYLDQPIISNEIPLLALPTTAGTGSEATRFAVIYANGEKQSIVHDSLIPSVVIMDASALLTLPDYQRKATMMDALCHAMESYWSVNSTEESRNYAKQALTLILETKEGYLANLPESNKAMLHAANIAGKAINITQTTAGHAMCYKLTSLYGLAHGHAAALCVAKLFPYMADHLDRCIDARGQEYLRRIFGEICALFRAEDAHQVGLMLDWMLRDMGLMAPKADANTDYDALVKSVNLTRLKNTPVELGNDAIDMLYHEIIK